MQQYFPSTIKILDRHNTFMKNKYLSIGLILCFQHSREKAIRGWVTVFAFPESPSICPVLTLKAYLDRTVHLRHADAINLLISQRKPHKSVTSQTLALWMKNIMAAAGIDTTVFKQHSTCGASAAWLEMRKSSDFQKDSKKWFENFIFQSSKSRDVFLV